MQAASEILRQHPELAIFLALSVGYALGKIRIGTFTLGSVTGVLLAGVAIGQFDVKVSSDLQTVFFLLFLFTIGYRVGPQFFSGLTKTGLPQIALTTLLCVTGLILAIAVSKIFGFDAGTAGGLVAGALTESATVGIASDAIRRLGLPDAQSQILLANVATAFAVSYLIGVICVTWFLSSVAPRIMRVDIVAACRELEASMGTKRAEEPGVVSAHRAFELRAFRLPHIAHGKTAADLESLFDRRVFVERVRRKGVMMPGARTMLLENGDVIALGGPRQTLMEAHRLIGAEEVEDTELLDIPATSVDVVLTSGKFAGKTLEDLGHDEAARGLFLRRITRGGNELPYTPRTILQRGDIVTLVGLKNHIDQVASAIGYVDRPTNATDMVVVGASIFLGGLIGLPSLHWHGLEIGLGVSIGALIGGLVCGWLRATHRFFAAIPEAALWLFDSLGLTAFIAVVGISAGPRFFAGLSEAGIGIVIGAILIVILPHLVTVLVGYYVMKMHPGILLGVCAGAGTSGPALAAVQEKADSKVPTLGYGLSYAVGNILLALWGTIIVAAVH
ncbi:aspartate-alanine antiporter [Microvirga terricola]|uniref:Aspartate-alanine antiporter n=1 Tax=Microvirga terricola TaxID=2719797 RepID=A0ABX0VD51_9HYPH|nr:aspartate-alanine antiporter [Microvirga terricola]NIX77770.1 aspartate-alanine antiporter [Microvirga terricola]